MYKRQEEERIELQKEKEFIECKLQIAKQIFLSAQKQLEEHIKKTVSYTHLDRDGAEAG